MSNHRDSSKFFKPAEKLELRQDKDNAYTVVLGELKEPSKELSYVPQRMVRTKPLTMEEMLEQIKEYNSVSPALHDEFLLPDYYTSPWRISGIDKGIAKHNELFDKIRRFSKENKSTMLYFSLEDTHIHRVYPEHIFTADVVLPVLHRRHIGNCGIEVVRGRDVSHGYSMTNSFGLFGRRTGKTAIISQFMDECVYPFIYTDQFSLPNKHSEPYWLKYVPLENRFKEIVKVNDRYISIKHIHTGIPEIDKLLTNGMSLKSLSEIWSYGTGL